MPFFLKTRLVRCGFLLPVWLMTAMLTLAPAAPAQASQPRYDDEPNELSWELLAQGYEAHQLWANWWERQPAAQKEAAIVAAKQAGMVQDTADEARTLVVHAQHLQGEHWNPATQAGRQVIKGHYGHNSYKARMVVDVPVAGPYRLWTRWFNTKGYFASFEVRIRPREMMDYAFDWQTSGQGDWLVHRVAFTPHRRQGGGEYALNFDASRHGFHWDASPMVDLPAGPVTLEVRSIVHGGPYTFRVIDDFVLTQDPLLDPSGMQLPDGAAEGATQQPLSADVARSSSAQERLTWQLRPGSQPLHETPAALAELWTRYRHELIDRLASGQSLTAYEKTLAQLHYFDERWNLVGTPAQVAHRVAELRTSLRAQGHFQWIEAEDFTQKQGWEAVRWAPSSGGAYLRAGYANGKAEALQNIHIPQAGRYRLWIKCTQYLDRYNVFDVRVLRGGQMVVHETSFDQMATFPEQDDQGDYRNKVVHHWKPIDLDLSAGGAYQIVLAKDKGKSPYGNRRVDVVVVTDDLDWQPMGNQQPTVVASPGQASQQSWQAWLGDAEDHWDGFQMTDAPTTDQPIPAKDATLAVQPGAVGQRVVHLTNFSDKPVTLTPRFEAAGSIEASWRVVASHQREIADWETPVVAYDWQPSSLLRRHSVTLPAGLTTTLWLTFDARESNAGQERVALHLDDDRVVDWAIDVTGQDIRQAAAPYVGGWCNLPTGAHSLATFRDIGLNIVHGSVLAREVQQAYGLKHYVLYIGPPKSAEHVREVVKAIESMGLTYEDWSWEIMDEPGQKVYPKWVEAAQAIRQADPRVRIWCNPGDIAVSTVEAVTAMAPYIDAFCPFINHFRNKDADYQKLLATLGSPKLLYTTPSRNEKNPDAPRSQLALADLAIEHGRDGWNSFSLFAYYPYSATAWDEVHNMLPDQAVCIYPGAWGSVISSRNLEATRQAIAVWKTHRQAGGVR